jgi:queuosine precursor transporter
MLDRFLPGLDKSLAVKLVLFHTFVIAISNWLVQYKFGFFGHPIAVSAFTFPLVVVATDLTVRMVGKELGRTVVALSFVPAIIASMLVVLASGAPAITAVRIGVGSGLAYLLGTLLDVYVFQYIRERYNSWWIAPTLASVVTTVIDTYTFFFTAFYKGANAFMAANWHIVATNHIIIKVLVGLLVVVPAYGLLLNYLQRRIK